MEPEVGSQGRFIDGERAVRLSCPMRGLDTGVLPSFFWIRGIVNGLRYTLVPLGFRSVVLPHHDESSSR